jgi:hypothetical protein
MYVPSRLRQNADAEIEDNREPETGEANELPLRHLNIGLSACVFAVAGEWQSGRRRTLNGDEVGNR